MNKNTVFPRAYIIKQIYKFMNKYEKENNFRFTGNQGVITFMNLLPKLYEVLKKDENCNLDGLTYEIFEQMALIGAMGIGIQLK